MGQPWGLSGGPFVGLYLATLVIAFGLAAVVRRVVTRGGATARAGRAAPAPKLNRYETAYLVGGPDRVVDTAIGGLLLDRSLLASRGGWLVASYHASPGVTRDVLADAVLRHLVRPGRRRRNVVVRALRRHPVVVAARERVTGTGLVVGRGRRAAVGVAALLPVAVVAVGVVRLVDVAPTHRAISGLVALLVLTGVPVLWLVLFRRVRHVPSARGRTLTRQLLADYDRIGRGGRAPAVQRAGIPLHGFNALTDPNVRVAFGRVSQGIVGVVGFDGRSGHDSLGFPDG